MSNSKINRRNFVSGSAAIALSAPAIINADIVNAAELEKTIGQLTILGLPGSAASHDSSKNLINHMAAGRAGGILMLRHNVKSREAVSGLTKAVINARSDAFITIDQEGGKVQRLSKGQGLNKIPTAQWVSGNISTKKARALYEKSGREMRAIGFNLNLAPSVDVHNPNNPVIGKYGRSFGTDPARIADFAGAFIDGFSRADVACAVKHFPGHGSSRSDSHNGFVDITTTWNDSELVPFQKLASKAHMVMGGHLYHSDFSRGKEPITFSRKALVGTLRKKLGYQGVIITDDLDMGAIRKKYSLKEACIRSLAAGNDLLLLSNSLKYDADLPANIINWVSGAVKDGRLTTASLNASRDRVMAVRNSIRF